MVHSAVVFPGQGAQQVGMGADIAASSSAGRSVFQRANDVLGFDLATACFEGPASLLEKTDVQQPAIFVTSMAIWEAFLEAGGSLDQFEFAAGLSLGEYSALCAAGAIEFVDAVRLVRRRGELMQEAAEASAGGMVTVVGADIPTAKELCNRAREGEVLVTANFNCPGQIVLSGHASACDRVAKLAEESGLRSVRLPVAGAFHSPLMEPAARGLQEELLRTTIRSPSVRVAANVDANYHGAPESIRQALSRQLVEPVLWQQCVERLQKDGAESFVEMGPGRVLTGLMRKIDRAARCVNVSAVAAIGGAVAGQPV
ncbi:MAG: ACP S-malonyltransferase [Phycisphaerae bacterium]|nr:ACP S-malonyltransferase [Phycisphaerae bacterium]